MWGTEGPGKDPEGSDISGTGGASQEESPRAVCEQPTVASCTTQGRGSWAGPSGPNSTAVRGHATNGFRGALHERGPAGGCRQLAQNVGCGGTGERGWWLEGALLAQPREAAILPGSLPPLLSSRLTGGFES